MAEKVFLGASLNQDTMAKLDKLAALLGSNRSAALRSILDAPLTTLLIVATSFSSDAEKKAADLLSVGRSAARAASNGASCLTIDTIQCSGTDDAKHILPQL